MRSYKQADFLKYLQTKKKKTWQYWYNDIKELTDLFDLCWEDKNDLYSVYKLNNHKYRNSPYHDHNIRASLSKHIDDIIKHRPHIVIDEIPADKLDRYLPIDEHYIQSLSWDDFNFSPINQDEYQVIELFYRREKNLKEIAAEIGLKYITAAKRLERGLAKLRANKEVFLQPRN